MVYVPPTATLSASWVGAPAYARPSSPLSAWWGGVDNGTGQRRLKQWGRDSLGVGQPLSTHWWEYPPPFAQIHASWQGAPSYTPTPSPLDARWQKPAPTGDSFIFDVGAGDVLQLGAQRIYNTQWISPVGADAQDLGQPLLEQKFTLHASWQGESAYWPPVRFVPGWWNGAAGYVLPVGVAAPAVLAPAIRNKSLSLRAVGWGSANVGADATVWNYNYHITLGGSSFMEVPSKHQIDLYERFLKPGGLSSQMFGAGRVTHGVQRVSAAGGADLNARGAPWVSRSPRHLEPAPIKAPEVMESHTVGGTRFVEPVGTEMTEWGERIIPEGASLYPQGFAGQAGAPDVQLHTRYVRPLAFVTNRDELRFGYQYVWNLRQYIRQDFDVEDGLNPPGFGRWTGIENRNKEPVPAGWLSERHGYTSIVNWAWAFLPTGIAAPDPLPTYKAGSVTHHHRPVLAGNLDSGVVSGWAAIYNNAELIRPIGTDAAAVGAPLPENRSRQYKDVGNFDASAAGKPMVADAIRNLSFEARYTIEPPPIALPEVKLHTRYVEDVSLGDRAGAGVPALDIRWTIITPRWAFHPPAWIGEPRLHNVTPELRTFGKNQEELGQAAVRTQWRRVETREGNMTQWGRAIVRDRRHWVEFVGALAPPHIMPGPVVTRVGGLPDPHNIIAPGIDVPPNVRDQVPKPLLNLLFAYPEGIEPPIIGGPAVTANSIRVEPGYAEYLVGQHQVTLKNRALTVERWPEHEVFEPSKPRISPHTIYAVFEAPAQAKKNHDPAQHHYVDHSPGDNTLLKGVGGGITVTLQHRVIRASGFAWPPVNVRWPEPQVRNATSYVHPEGVNVARLGVPSVPGDQEIVQFKSQLTQEFGAHVVAPPPYTGPRFVAARSVPLPEGIAGHAIEFKDRVRSVSGWHSLRMGASKDGDRPFMWQGLRVGPLIPNVVQGFEADQYGVTWVSLRVRDVRAPGWESFISEYDLENFAHRMRVRTTPLPAPPTQHLHPYGRPPEHVGTPSTRVGRHYIRPDGNAEQYRKGAPAS